MSPNILTFYAYFGIDPRVMQIYNEMNVMQTKPCGTHKRIESAEQDPIRPKALRSEEPSQKTKEKIKTYMNHDV